MATANRNVEMANYNYVSSPELSSLPSESPSEPGSPPLDQRPQNDEIIVGASAPLFPPLQPQQPFSLDGVRAAKENISRKKPGRKPGSIVKKAGENAASPAGTADIAKPRRVRKPRDPNLPPIQRKKRASAAAPESGAPRSLSMQYPHSTIQLTSMRVDMAPRSNSSVPTAATPASTAQPPRQPPLSMVESRTKREMPSSMQSILNSEDEPPRVPVAATPAATPPARSTVRYDPVRGTMLPHDSYSSNTGPSGSPHGPTHKANPASASPSIASLVEPTISHPRSPISHSLSLHPSPSHYGTSSISATDTQPHSYHDTISSLPPSPSPSPAIHNLVSAPSLQPKLAAAKSKAAPTLAMAAHKATSTDTIAASTTAPTSKSSSTSAKLATPKTETNGKSSRVSSAGLTAKSASKASAKTAQRTSASKAAAAAAVTGATVAPTKLTGPVTSSFRDVAVSKNSASTASPASSIPLIKKFSSILQERGGKQNKVPSSFTPTQKLAVGKEDATSQPMALDSVSSPTTNEPQRSILDFGKARPGEEMQAPSIVLHIPLIRGETNRYVNFMRMAEDHYGWDALHPRLAAHRDRKARIAAASAALERNGSGRESGDEMTDDLQSGDEGSNEEGEHGANGVAGSEGGPVKPARKKKRIFKEDEYDKDDDFVDDSEMLWEEQAAASRDGFFVYSGPLVPEEEKPDEGAAPPTKRGRGKQSARTGRATAARPEGGRKTGGSTARGTTTARKPRVTKQEKEQREREKAETEKAAQASAAKAASNAADEASLPSAMAIDT